MTKRFRKGGRAVIPKDVRVHSTHPKWPEGGKLTTRACIVTPMHDVFDDGRSKALYWLGPGGHWRWCDADEAKPGPSDLELLAQVAR